MNEVLNEFLAYNIFNNTVKDYLLAAFTLIALFTALMLFKQLLLGRLRKFAEKTANNFDDFIVSLLAQIGPPVFLAASLYYASSGIQLSGAIRTGIRYFLVIAVTVRAILIFQEIVRYAISESYRRSRPEDPVAEGVTRSITQIIRWAIWILGAVFVLDNFGVNISALVAGLGIGGVAVALASQTILGDLFSAFSIFVDKPFEIGDFVIVDDLMGTVEHIGLKTTRLRSLSGEQLVISNSDLTKSRIKNYKRMQVRRVVFKIGVVYDTPLEKLKKIPELIKTILQKTEGVKIDRSHFQSFGDFALIFETVYFVQSADYNVYMDKQQWINFALKETFEREGIFFAYPTQTLYVQK